MSSRIDYDLIYCESIERRKEASQDEKQYRRMKAIFVEAI
jgi:hypothetical protein